MVFLLQTKVFFYHTNKFALFENTYNTYVNAHTQPLGLTQRHTHAQARTHDRIHPGAHIHTFGFAIQRNWNFYNGNILNAYIVATKRLRLI